MSNARVRHKRRYRAARARFYFPSIPEGAKQRRRDAKNVEGYRSMSARARRRYRKKHPEFATWLRAVGGVWTPWRAGLPEQMKERR